MSSTMRITGMASGLDVDTLVKQMMKSQSVKVDKLKQDRQILQWRQDNYRELLGDTNTFKSTYFDVLKIDSNMLSANNYAGLDTTSVDSASSTQSPTATATVGVGAQSGVYSVVVNKVAKSASIQGASLTNATINTELSDVGVSSPTTFNITYNGISKPVTIDPSDTINSFINKVAAATSNNVTAKFSELTGKMTLQTLSTGSSNNISIDSTLLGMTAGAGTQGQDAEVMITPPGAEGSKTIIKSTNNFVIDGMSYTLQSADTAKTTKITVASNVQKTFDKIKTFIDKYNELIAKIKTEVDEKKNNSFKPLTDDQRTNMKDEDIKKWEDKAKQGLLNRDSGLQNMLYSLRSAFFDSVKDAGISLNEVGLSTDSDYTNGGKIIIDEVKLKDKIQNNGSQVANLFMKDSGVSYDPDHKIDLGRYSSEGIFQRINDVLKDYTRTTRDSNNRKGILIEKAGIKGDLSEFSNSLSNDITNNYDKRITELTKKLAEKENKYYAQFSKLEVAMQKLNSQSSWLSQQLGTTSSN